MQRGAKARSYFRVSERLELDDDDALGESGAFHPLQVEQIRAAASALRSPAAVEPAVVCGAIAWLDRLGDLAEQGPEMLMNAVFGRGGTSGRSYRLEVLMECVLLSGLVSNSSNLAAVLASSARLLLGCLAASPLLKTLEDPNFKRPSKTTVSYHRLSIDAAYCSLVRAHWTQLLAEADRGQDFQIYFLCDASPRGGKDWLLCEMFVVRDADCEKLCRLQDEIVQHRGRNASEWTGRDDDDDNDPTRDSAVLRRLSAEMHGCVWHHVLVPLALGLGATSLHQKIVLILHGLRLEATSWSMVRRLLARMVSITTDFGVESGLQQAPPLDPNDLLPHWSEATQTDENALVDDVAEGAPAPAIASGDAGRPLVGFREPLAVPGCLHICSNALDDMTKRLPHYAEWLEKAKAVSHFLSQRASKDALLHTCFNEPPALHFRDSVEHFNAEIYDKRFGSLMRFLSEVMPLRGVLQEYFKLSALHLSEDTTQVQLVGSAIHSLWWWGYSHVLLTVGGVVQDLQFHIEGCRCHPASAFELHGAASYAQRRTAYKQESSASLPCPLRGCSCAPALACGDLQDLRDKALSACSLQLVQGLTGCTEGERQQLLQVFDEARRFVEYILDLKLSHWQQLPWLLCGLGHYDEGRARAAGHAAQAAWDRTAPVRSTHEPFTTNFFTSGTMMDEFGRFLAGTPRCELPHLQRFGYRVRLVHCMETSVERLHRLSSMGLARAPAARGQFLSLFCGRRDEITRHVLGDPSNRENLPRLGSAAELADAFAKARNPPGMVSLLELERHLLWATRPLELAKAGKPWRPHQAHKEVAAMMYRYDLDSMFFKRSALQQTVVQFKNQRRSALMPPVAKVERVEKDGVGGALVGRAAFDHFRDHADLNRMYTMRSPQAPLLVLAEALAGPPQNEATGEALLDDVAALPQVSRGPGRFVAFTLVHRAPKRQKLVPAVGSRLRSDHLALSVLQIESVERAGDGQPQTLGVSMQSSDDSKTVLLGLDDFLKVGLENVLRIRHWRRDAVKLRLEEGALHDCCQEAVHSLLSALVAKGIPTPLPAVGVQPDVLGLGAAECAQQLLQRGYLQRTVRASLPLKACVCVEFHPFAPEHPFRVPMHCLNESCAIATRRVLATSGY